MKTPQKVPASVRKAQGARLAKARRDAGFSSARSAAMENNWKESTYSAHERGSRTIGDDDAERYARRFRTKGAIITAREIIFGELGVNGPSPPDDAMRAVFEASLHALGAPDGKARSAAQEILALLEGGIEPALGVTADQAVRQRVAEIIRKYFPKASRKK